jgi:hypothetical protein
VHLLDLRGVDHQVIDSSSVNRASLAPPRNGRHDDTKVMPQNGSSPALQAGSRVDQKGKIEDDTSTFSVFMLQCTLQAGCTCVMKLRCWWQFAFMFGLGVMLARMRLDPYSGTV